MPVKATATTARATRLRRFSAAGLVTAGAAAAALSMAPTAQADDQGSLSASAASVSAASITDQVHSAPASEKKADKADKADKKDYANNLDGWIRESLDIMKSKDIPGTYEGLHKNIMRESGGDPNAENGWDVNAQNGTPSKGLLQVIQPTFDSYHVKGTPDDSTDPVANITAAANYAADRYGSIDNVDSAY